MNDDEIAEIIKAYQSGKRFDLVQAFYRGKWGAIWTVPPCSPSSMQKALRQFLREGAEHIRLIRSVNIMTPSRTVSAVITAEFPAGEQMVYDLITGKRLKAPYLHDAVMDVIESAFSSK